MFSLRWVFSSTNSTSASLVGCTLWPQGEFRNWQLARLQSLASSGSSHKHRSMDSPSPTHAPYYSALKQEIPLSSLSSPTIMMSRTFQLGLRLQSKLPTAISHNSPRRRAQFLRRWMREYPEHS